MPRQHQLTEPRFPIKLTLAQRQILAKLAPNFADRLKLAEPHQRIADFTEAELKRIKAVAEDAIPTVSTGFERRPLRLIVKTTDKAIAQSQRLSAADTVYQFKITLLESQPPIWRRIQVRDCSLDQLHEHIQTSMGWTNSHLNQFEIDKQRYADPLLMEEDFEELDCKDSTTTMLSSILPKNGKLRFAYEYDFGDSWSHEILFEGILRAEAKTKYPRCVDGARACPPEDCGGVWGYADFLNAVRDKNHEQHRDMLEWIGRRRFDPEAFSPEKATKGMKRGQPDWRRMM